MILEGNSDPHEGRGYESLRRPCSYSGRSPAPLVVREVPPLSRFSGLLRQRSRPTLQLLAIDHSLRALAVTGSLHRNRGGGALNFAEISLAELDGCRRDILLQPM
jgi:hypothetical protein